MRSRTRNLGVLIAACLAAAALLWYFRPREAADTLRDRTCSLTVDCRVLSGSMDAVPTEKKSLVPADGLLLARTEVSFSDGETAFDVLKRELTARRIHFEFTDASIYGSVYIEGIGNLYEGDCGGMSGWMFSVNGVFPGASCGNYILSDGDDVVFVYTLSLGGDIGNAYDAGE